jgi:hypothetical protein
MLGVPDLMLSINLMLVVLIVGGVALAVWTKEE